LTPDPSLRTRDRPAIEVLRDRNFRLFFPAGLASQIGRWAWFLLSGYLVLQLTGSTFLTQLVGVAFTLPLFLGGAVFGVITDAFDRRWVILTGQTLNVGLATVAALLVFTGIVAAWHIIVLTFVLGASFTLDQIARRTMVLDMVDERLLPYGIGLDGVNMTAGLMVGSFLAGFLLDVIPDVENLNAAWTYVMTAVMFALAIILIQGIRVSRTHDRLGLGIRASISGIGDGFRVVAKSRAIIGVFGITILFNLVFPPHAPLIPVFAQKILEVGPTAMGMLGSASGLGALIGTLYIISKRRIGSRSRYYYGGTLLCIASLFVFGVSGYYPLSLLGLFIAGAGMAGFGTMQATLILTSVGEGMRGRLMGIQSMAIGVIPIGSLVMGALAELWGPRQAVAGVAAVGFVMTVAWVAVAKELRRL
jgi:MFS family permease